MHGSARQQRHRLSPYWISRRKHFDRNGEISTDEFISCFWVICQVLETVLDFWMSQFCHLKRVNKNLSKSNAGPAIDCAISLFEPTHNCASIRIWIIRRIIRWEPLPSPLHSHEWRRPFLRFSLESYACVRRRYSTFSLSLSLCVFDGLRALRAYHNHHQFASKHISVFVSSSST